MRSSNWGPQKKDCMRKRKQDRNIGFLLNHRPSGTITAVITRKKKKGNVLASPDMLWFRYKRLEHTRITQIWQMRNLKICWERYFWLSYTQCKRLKMPTNPSLQHLAPKSVWHVTEAERQAHTFPNIFYT